MLVREERGSALTIFAVVAPVFILFLALALDVGNWFSHKRQLQNRADAGALAAGVEYQKNLIPCINGTGTALSAAADAVAAAARGYAGDPTATGTLYNLQPTNQGSISVAINSATFGGANYSDAPPVRGTPCYKHTTAEGDWISPAGGRWTDVKVKETNIPTLFGTFGINVPAITARARLQVAPATSDNQFVPLGVPDSLVDHAEARFYNACPGKAPTDPDYYLTVGGQSKLDLVPLAAGSQTVQFVSLWGASDGQPHTISLPTGGTCLGGNAQGQNGFIPIGVEIRVAGFSWINLDSASCNTLHNTTRYADCWRDPIAVRVWDAPALNTGDPVVGDVRLINSGGSPACQYDPHFTSTAGCSTLANVDVTWGDRVGPTLSHATYTVSLNSTVLAAPAGWNGTWSGSGLLPGASDTTNATVTWSWEDTNTSDVWPNHTGLPNGGHCRPDSKKNPNPCQETGTNMVHQMFTANDTNSGFLKLVQLSNGGTPGTGASIYDSVQKGPGTTASVTLTVGIRAPFNPLTTNPLSVLRTDQNQGNQALNCGTSSQGDDFSEFQTGCSNFYSENQWAITNTDSSPAVWWTGSPLGCPSASTVRAQPNDAALHSWKCVQVAPGNGFSAPAVACGIAARTGNAPGATGQNCQSQLQCLHPNRYADYIAGTDDAGDPRVIKVFVLPLGAFKGVTGGSDSVPVRDFGAFYVTGWNLNSQRQDPCITGDPQNREDSPQLNEIVGHFVKWTDNNTGPADLTQDCDLSQLRPCRTVLVR